MISIMLSMSENNAGNLLRLCLALQDDAAGCVQVHTSASCIDDPMWSVGLNMHESVGVDNGDYIVIRSSHSVLVSRNIGKLTRIWLLYIYDRATGVNW